MAFPPAFDRAWDETFPPDTQLANLLGQDIRNFKTDIRERLSLLSGTFANRPSNMDAIYGGAGFGILYFSTDTQQLFQWNGAAWVQIPFTGSVVASVNLTAQAAAIATTTLYAVPTSGIYRVSADSIITQVGTGGIISMVIGWNNGLLGITEASAGNGVTLLGREDSLFVGGPSQNPSCIFVPNGQNITYATTFSGVTGAPQYSFRARVEFLG